MADLCIFIYSAGKILMPCVGVLEWGPDCRNPFCGLGVHGKEAVGSIASSLACYYPSSPAAKGENPIPLYCRITSQTIP